MDGTLLNSELYYMDAVFKLLKDYNYPNDLKDGCSIIGTSMDVTYQILSDLIDNVISPTKVKELLDYTYQNNPMVIKDIVFDYVVDTIKWFKQQGIKVAICSSTHIDGIKHVISELDISEYIDYYISGCDIDNPKPAGDIYLMALDYLKLDKDQVIIYEDSYSGIMAGLNAGVYTIAREELRFNIDQSGADKIVKDILELKEFVKGKLDQYGRVISYKWW